MVTWMAWSLMVPWSAPFLYEQGGFHFHVSESEYIHNIVMFIYYYAWCYLGHHTPTRLTTSELLSCQWLHSSKPLIQSNPRLPYITGGPAQATTKGSPNMQGSPGLGSKRKLMPVPRSTTTHDLKPLFFSFWGSCNLPAAH